MVGTRVLVVGADAEPGAVFAALKAYPCRKVHILSTPREREEGQSLGSILEDEAIASRLWVLHADANEDIFATAGQIIAEEPDATLLVSGVFQASLVSAAYVHGVRALLQEGNRVRELPVLPYDYATQLADAKMSILQAIRHKPVLLQDVIKITHLKANTLSYHLHGGQGKPGLFSMGIASTDDKKRLTITPKGRSLVRGLEFCTPRGRTKKNK